jgi:hypothetical protein
LCQAVRYHPSQVIAALDHVEANRKFIRSTRAVFLHQLPKQPIVENQSLLPVYTVSDFGGFQIEHLKVWYPTHWRQASQHFGLSVE